MSDGLPTPTGAPDGMRFSVVATVRNERDTIAPFLDSLLEQTLRPFEIVIVDGASTDGTLEVLQRYAAQQGIRVISEPTNIAQGRNLGISHAAGSHIAVTDAGCRVDRRWLESLTACFAADPELDVVAGNFRFETRTPFEEAVVLATFGPNRDDTDAARYYPSSRSVAFTKSAWAKAGGYPEWLYAAEDTLFNIRLRQVGCKFAFCRDAVVRWRPRETWRALARQRFNYSLGNARVGIGTSGYLLNLRVHALMALLLLLSPWQPLCLLPALAVLALHVRRHLWPQAALVTQGRGAGMRLRVLAVMEYVRLVGLWGFLRGRWQRFNDAAYIAHLRRYMGVASVDELDWV